MILTRGLVRVKENRQFFLELPLEEKRKLYKCKDQFITLAKVPTWKEYFKNEKLYLNKAKKRQINAEDKIISNDLNSIIGVFKGDITTLEIDAIVNAANSSLSGGGGVNGAIQKAAGKNMLAECETLNGCETGNAKTTAGYELPARYVIHAVGPMGEKPEFLQQCYLNCLKQAVENKCRSIAFPCISTGIYGYPNESAARLVTKTIREYLDENHKNFDRIVFCLFMDKDIKLYHDYLTIYFPIEQK